jgi:hypothetical protein
MNGLTTVVAGHPGYLRIVVISTLGATTVVGGGVAADSTAYYDNYPSPPFDISEHLAETKEDRKRLYRRERENDAATAMHFGGQRTPRREARQHGDPLRHHRLRGFRRASRRNQTEFRVEGANS